MHSMHLLFLPGHNVSVVESGFTSDAAAAEMDITKASAILFPFIMVICCCVLEFLSKTPT